MSSAEKKSAPATTEIDQLRSAVFKLKADLEEANSRYNEAQKIFCDESLRRAGDVKKSTDKLQAHWEKQVAALKEDHQAEIKRIHASYAMQPSAAKASRARYN